MSKWKWPLGSKSDWVHDEGKKVLDKMKFLVLNQKESDFELFFSLGHTVNRKTIEYYKSAECFIFQHRACLTFE